MAEQQPDIQLIANLVVLRPDGNVLFVRYHADDNVRLRRGLLCRIGDRRAFAGQRRSLVPVSVEYHQWEARSHHPARHPRAHDSQAKNCYLRFRHGFLISLELC